MKHFVRIFALFMSILLLAGCSQTDQTMGKKEESYYLSITATGESSDPAHQTGLASGVYTYDINTKQLDHITEIEYASQYALTAYDRARNTVYFSERVYLTEENYGDQLFAYNLTTKKKTQLTSSIFALNYIIPQEDKLYLLVSPAKYGGMQPGVYDLKTGTLELYDIAEGFCTLLMTYHQASGCFYVEGCDWADYNDFLANQHSRGRPDYSIYRIKDDWSQPELIAATEQEKIETITAKGDGTVFYTTWKQYMYRPQAPQVTEAPSEYDFSQIMSTVKDAVFLGDTNTMFFIGNGSEHPRGIYSYDFDTKELTQIFVVEEGFINNFTLLKAA